MKMVKKLKKSSFEPHLNQKFEIYPQEGKKVKVELVRITEDKKGNVESFSVLFRGPKDNPLAHDTHKVKHPKMGEFNLFLGPVVTEKTDGVYYQAVFTRLVEKK